MVISSIFESRNFEGIPAVPAVVHGYDTAASDHEHYVSLVLSGPAEGGGESEDSGSHHYSLTDPGHLFELCLQAVLGPVPEYGLHLWAAPAHLGLGLGRLGARYVHCTFGSTNPSIVSRSSREYAS